ncbi:MAG: PP2C family protein-serine/threonine phosphatase [Melioribacteraceae bacterium]|nr:PP2C family protein-serine/threonine phosphatase [Melioribacteraceae bacterium]MCF8265679.1 PP2C family protein-serine/threonine phosphatase [Melioribacteraceae bacterium]
MSLPSSDLLNSRKFEIATALSLLLFLFRIVFSTVNSPLLLILNELLVLSSLYFWILYITNFINEKEHTPISLVLNAGILNAILFFIIAITTVLFDKLPEDEISFGFFEALILLLLGFITLGIATYIISGFSELMKLKQKRNPAKYFNSMMLFFLFSAILFAYSQFDNSLKSVDNAVYVVAICLITFNALRVSWIAFLVKKQKLQLLIISIVLIILFGFNFSFTMESDFFNQAMINFSPGIYRSLNLIMLYGVIYFVIIFFTALFHLPTAEAFDKKSEEISSLFDLSKLLTSVFDFKDLAENITSITTKVYNSDSAWLLTREGDEYKLSSVSGIGYMQAEKITESVLEKYDYNLSEVLIIDKKKIKFRVRNDIVSFNFDSMAIAPLKVHNQIEGFLFVARKSDSRFESEDKKAIAAYADYAAIALENAKLIKESLEKERLEKEMEVAREIQYKLLPNKIPSFKDLEISAVFIPAFEVGGDYYDFFEVGEKNLAFVVADVSGKGISAAFIMAEIKGIFESLSKTISQPKVLLNYANDIINQSLEKKYFVTAIYGIIDMQNGKLTFGRAGHTPLHLFRDNSVKRLRPNGIGLGLDHGNKFASTLEEMEIQLNNNDILILYSDGITEAQNGINEEFGYDKLDTIVTENWRKNASEISNEIIKNVTTFSKDKAQHDDITLVVFKSNFNNKQIEVG